MNKMSQTITQLRFPLAIAIVYFHTSLEDYSVGTSYDLFRKIFGMFFSNMAVPLFFCISGYLFFVKNTEGLSFSEYNIKLKKRVKTLIIPYIVWNIITLIFRSSIELATTKHLYYDWKNLLPDILGHWDKNELVFFPADGVLWFINVLFIFALLSPVLYKLVKYGGIYWLIFTALLAGYASTYTLFTTSLFFYSCGIYASINRKTFIIENKPIAILISAIFILFNICRIVLSQMGFLELQWFYGPISLIGMFVFFSIANKTMNNSRLSQLPDLGALCFVLYAAHTLINSYCVRSFFIVFPTSNDFYLIIFHLIGPLITITIISFCLYSLRRVWPNSLKFIAGR